MSEEENTPAAEEKSVAVESAETTADEAKPAADKELPESERAETTIPEISEMKVPLWIKLMWAGFVIWLIWYIVMGLQSSPDKWA
ncbi:MAG: hypothetical protein KDB32_02005 [Planctomycetes bacterium]|nr:hypothetical protein [Planctomycetota bacterium]